MNAIVENTLVEHHNYFSKKDITLLHDEFMNILRFINNSETEAELRVIFTNYPLEHFKVGFGSSHMWVKQVINGDAKQQVIFVSL